VEKVMNTWEELQINGIFTTLGSILVSNLETMEHTPLIEITLGKIKDLPNRLEIS